MNQIQNTTERADMAEGYAGVSLSELAQKSDVELATWQSGWTPGTDKHILAEKEWQRRIALRELKEQFRLEERLANGNRWWAIAAATISVIGTLLGVWLGRQLEPICQAATPQVSATTPTWSTQQPATSTTAKSAASSTTLLPTKKAPYDGARDLEEILPSFVPHS